MSVASADDSYRPLERSCEGSTEKAEAEGFKFKNTLVYQRAPVRGAGGGGGARKERRGQGREESNKQKPKSSPRKTT